MIFLKFLNSVPSFPRRNLVGGASILLIERLGDCLAVALFASGSLVLFTDLHVYIAAEPLLYALVRRPVAAPSKAGGVLLTTNRDLKPIANGDIVSHSALARLSGRYLGYTRANERVPHAECSYRLCRCVRRTFGLSIQREGCTRCDTSDTTSRCKCR
jgi:hypothetical protein